MGNTVTRSHIRDADRGVAKATRDNTRRNSAFPSSLAHHSTLPPTTSSPTNLNSPLSASPLLSAQYPHPVAPDAPTIPDTSHHPIVNLPSKLSLSRPDPPVDPPLPPRVVRQRTVETSPDRPSQTTKRRQRHASADIAFSRSMSANSSVPNDNRSTRSNSSSFPASAPEPTVNSQPDSVHTADRDDPNALHRLTSRVPSTSAPLTSSASNTASLPLTDTPPASSTIDPVENPLPSPSPSNSNSTYRSVPRIDPTLPGASLRDCQTARTQTPPRVDKPPRARKVVSFNENVRIVTYPYEGSDTYSSSSELPSVNRFPDKPSKRRGRSIIRILSRPPPSSPHPSADPFDNAPYDAFSPSALGLQTEIVYDHITSRPPLAIDYSDGDPDREDEDSDHLEPSADASFIVPFEPPPPHLLDSHSALPATGNAVVEDCFDYTDRRDSDNDDTLSLSDAHPSCDGIDEPEAIVDPLRSVGKDDIPVATRAGSSFDIAPLWQRLKRVDELDAVDMQRTSFIKSKMAPQSIPAAIGRRFTSDARNFSASAKDMLVFSRQPRNFTKAQQLLSELTPSDPLCVSDTITSVAASENVTHTSSASSVPTSSSDQTPVSDPTSASLSTSNSQSLGEQPTLSLPDAQSVGAGSRTASDPTTSCPTNSNGENNHSDSEQNVTEENCSIESDKPAKDEMSLKLGERKFSEDQHPSSYHFDTRLKVPSQAKRSESLELNVSRDSSNQVGATSAIFSTTAHLNVSTIAPATREPIKSFSRWLARDDVSIDTSVAEDLIQATGDNTAEIESERLVSTDEKWEDARPMSSSIEKFGCHVTGMSCLKRDVVQSAEDDNFVLSRDHNLDGPARSSSSKRRKVEREMGVGLDVADSAVSITRSLVGHNQGNDDGDGDDITPTASVRHKQLQSSPPIGDRELPMLGSLVMDASSRDITRKYSNESRSSTAGRISWRGGDHERRNNQSLSGPGSGPGHTVRDSTDMGQDDQVAGNLFRGEGTDEAEPSLAQPAMSENSSTLESEFDESGNFANEHLLSERMDVNAGDYSDDEILSDLDLDAIQISSHDDYSVPGIVQAREASPLAGVYYGTSSPSVVDQQSHETDGSGAEGAPRYPEYKVLNGLLKDEIMFRSGLHSSDLEEEGEWGVVVPREERVVEKTSTVKLSTRSVRKNNNEAVREKQPEKVVPEVLLHEWSGDTPLEPAIEMEDSLPNSRSSSSPNLDVEEHTKAANETSETIHESCTKLGLESSMTYRSASNSKNTDGERRLPSAVRPSSTTRRRKSSSTKVASTHMTVDEIAAGFAKNLRTFVKGTNTNGTADEIAVGVAQDAKKLSEHLEPELFDSNLKREVPQAEIGTATRTQDFEDGDQVEVRDRSEQKRLRRKEFNAPLPNGYAIDPRLQDFQLSVERKSVSEIGYRRNRRGSNGTNAPLGLNLDVADGSARMLGNDEIRVRPNLFERGASFVEHDFGRTEVFRSKGDEEFGYKWDTKRRYGGLRGRRLSNVETTGRSGSQEESVAHRGVVGRLRSRMHMARKLVSPNQ